MPYDGRPSLLIVIRFTERLEADRTKSLALLLANLAGSLLFQGSRLAS